MGGGMFRPTQKARRSKTNTTQSYQETNNVDILLQPDFLNEVIKECIEHALIDDQSIRLMIKQKYEFYLSCLRLPKMDNFSKTDAGIYCYLMKDNEPEFIHKTEVIPDEQDPVFAKPLTISFDYAQNNKDLIFNIYDIDKYNQFGEHERQYIGTVQTSIASIINEETFISAIRYDEKQSGETKKDIQIQKKINKHTQNQQKGEFRIRSYNCDSYSDNYIFQIEGINIKSKESIYLRIVTLNKTWNLNYEQDKNNNTFNNNSVNNNINNNANNLNNNNNIILNTNTDVKSDEPREIPLYQTDLVKNQKAIQWYRFEIQEKKINKYLKFEVYQFYESRVKKELIGELKISKENINALHATEQTIHLSNKKTPYGNLRFQKVTKMMHPHTLLQYIYGGLNVQFMMAFDYSQPQTNIYSSDQEVQNNQQYLMNQYESAINNCIDLIRFYQTNQMVPMYGLGARLPPSYIHHSNCFALSGDWYDPEVDLRDKNHATNIFKSTFKKIKPSSSLVFSELLKFANQYCKEEEFNQNKQTLCILLIFSHNELLESDIDETIQQLNKFVDTVEVPFQVINIGIGPQRFQYIQSILSEDNYLTSKKFSFIPYEQFKNDQFSFCSEIFKNIPKQLLEKARNQRIAPLKAFENTADARDYYLQTLTIGQKKTFGCINERPFFDYLTQELGYKVDIIKDIFVNGLEEEDLGLVLDRIGIYTKLALSQNNSRFYPIKSSVDSVPDKLIQKAKNYYRLKEKFNAHTKKQESKTLAIQKQNSDNLSPFSFFYKSDTKNDKSEEKGQKQQQSDYPEFYMHTKMNSANNLQQNEYNSQKGYSSQSANKNEDIENNFSYNNTPKKKQNNGQSSSQSEQNQKKYNNNNMKQNNFFNKWRDALDQQAKINNSPMRNDKKFKPVIQGIQCNFCSGDTIQIILMPCGHNCCCQEYLDQFDDQNCPICHIFVIQIVKFYGNEQDDYMSNNINKNVSFSQNRQNKRSKSPEKSYNINNNIINNNNNNVISNNSLDRVEKKKETVGVGEQETGQIEIFVDKQEMQSYLPNKKRDRYRTSYDSNIVLKY